MIYKIINNIFDIIKYTFAFVFMFGIGASSINYGITEINKNVIFSLVSIAFGLLMITLVLYSLYFLLVRGKKVTSTIDTVNKKYGTNFHKKNGFGEGCSVFFDVSSRKLLFTTGWDYRVESFDFIRQWELTWIEKSSNGGLWYENVVMKFHTNDYSLPIMGIKCGSKSEGEEWNSRLELIFA